MSPILCTTNFKLSFSQTIVFHFAILQIGWICIFLTISSSLTTEGLRRGFPRPSPLRLLHEDQCGSVVRIDCLDREVRRAHVHSRMNPRSSRLPICAQLTDEQLLQKLKDIGGYNPIYVAINITDARKFKDPRTFEKEKPKVPKSTRAPNCRNNSTPPPSPSQTPPPTTYGPPTPNPTTRPPVETPRPSPRDVYDEDMKKITPLEKLLEKLNDLKEDDLKLVRKLVKRSSSSVGNCWLKGSFVSGSRDRRINMCSECQLMTRLAADEMPQFINEVACGHDLPASSGQASHDNQCYASTGLCTQHVIRFPAMKRNGYVRDNDLSSRNGREIYVERWAISTKDIRAGCKCEMYTSHAQLLKSIENYS